MLRHRGRRSGKPRITPLIYATWAGEVVVVASNAGAAQHPSWYLNLIAHDIVELQIATQAYRATWREPVGAERDRVWSFMVAVFPKYADYQAATERQIPLVLLTVREAIATF